MTAAAPMVPSIRQRLFPETIWADISDARKGRSDAALRDLATAYWRPLYLYLRGGGRSHEDSSDLVQGFLSHVFSTDFFAHVERDRGRFRAYLLASLQRWLSREYTRATAQKRGGTIQHVPWEELDSQRDAPELSDDLEPSLLFDRSWATELVERALGALREEYERRNRAELFSALSPGLPGHAQRGMVQTYAQVAEELSMSEGAIKKAAFDLRTRFAEILRGQIRATVQTPEEAEEELRYLVQILSAA